MYNLGPAAKSCPPPAEVNALEVVSKGQIMFESKAQADEKAQHTWEYVSILKRLATQLSDIKWGFETTSKERCARAAHNLILTCRHNADLTSIPLFCICSLFLP
jgi:hypothetical protein